MVTVRLRLMMHGIIGSIDPGESAELGVSVYGGLPDYTYAWSPAASLDDSTSAEVVATPYATTTYTVEVIDAAGQRATGEITVNVNAGEAPVACFSYQPTQPQAGIGVTFDAQCSTGTIAEYRWWWNWDLHGDNGEPDEVYTSAFATTIYETEGAYYVRLVVSDGFGGESEHIDYLFVD
jgi:PKD repeat protein